MATISPTSAPGVGETAARLRMAITRTARRMRQEADSGLSPSQTAALATIDRHGPLTPSEVADHERIKRPTATRVIARLVEAGLVDKTQDSDDRRAWLVTSTRKGTDLLERQRTRKNAYLARRLRDLPSENLATLEAASGVLERLLEDEPR